MQFLISNFLKGLLFVVPLFVTGLVFNFLFRKVDGWLGLPWPGVGFAITLIATILIGALASNIFFAKILGYMEKILTRLPFVKLMYFSLKDLTGAFVGEKKRFTIPVLVRLAADGGINALGFVTAETLDLPGAAGLVGVYFPQSYNFAGNVLLIPNERVQRLAPQEAARLMAFIVSGGVSTGTGLGPDFATQKVPVL